MATEQLSSGLVLACSFLFIPTTVALTGLRFYMRRVQYEALKVDDWLTLPASILTLGLQITMIIEYSKGMIGFPDPNFVPGKPDASSNLPFWPFELQQTLALTFIKLSLVFFYRRIFNFGGPSFGNIGTLVAIILIALWGVAYFLAFLFICDGDPSNYWKSALDERRYCVKTQELNLSSAVSDMILDVIVLLLPLPLIWRLKMSTGRKLAVTSVFSLGLITVAVSVTRMVIYVQATTDRYDAQLDFEYLITAVIYWSMIEIGLAFIVSNILVVHRVFTRPVFRNFFASLSSMIPLRSRSQKSKDDLTIYDSAAWNNNSDANNSRSATYLSHDGHDSPSSHEIKGAESSSRDDESVDMFKVHQINDRNN